MTTFYYQPAQKFWTPKFQEFLSLEEIEYRAMLAKDAEVLVRETPPWKVQAKMAENAQKAIGL